MQHHHYRRDIWRTLRWLVVLSIFAAMGLGVWLVSAGIGPQRP